MFVRMLNRGVMAGILAVAVSVLVVVVGCAGGPARYNRQLARTGPPAVHAVHSQRLQEVMASLDRYALRDMPQEIDTSRQREQALRDAAAAARGLAASSNHIVDLLADVSMSEEHRELFVSLADKLGDQAGELQQQVHAGDLDAMSDSMNGVLATCNACHTAFRVLPVVK